MLLSVLAAFAAAHVAASRHLLHAYPGSWSWTELLVDYAGGFTKRGLLGEAAYRSQGWISPGRFVVDVICGAYLLASAGLILVFRMPETFPGLLFLLSPAGWLFPLLNPAAYGRKDAVVVAALVTALAIVTRWRRRTAALAATMAIFALAGLIVEVSWFYYPLVVAVFLARWHREPLRWRFGVCAAGGGYTLLCLVLTLLAPPADPGAIAASWPDGPYATDRAGALCCLDFGFAAAAGVAHATLPNLRGYAVAAVLGLLPLALLLARRRTVRVDLLAQGVALAGGLSALFPLAVTSDWGRYIYLWLTATFLAAWSASCEPSGAAGEGRSLDEVITRGALLAIYASTWQVVHYQYPDRSAVIPGALFRVLGASGVTPLAD